MWSLKCTSLISLILLSRSLILTSGFSSSLDNREVTVYGINSIMMLKHGYSWVTEDFELEEDIDTVTFCLFFMLQYVDRDTALFLETDPTAYLLVENNQFLLRIGDEDIVDSNETLRFWRWTHVCVTLGPRTAIYVDGVRTTKIVSIQKYFQDEDHFTIRIGKSPTNSTSYAEPFSGLTTQAQVYFRSLTTEEISDLVSCNELKSGRETHGELKYEECIIKGQDSHCREHLRGSIGGQSGELAINGDSSEEKDGDAKEGKSSNACNRRPHRHYMDSGDDCPLTKLACMGKRFRNEICGPLLPKSYFLQQQVKKFTSIEAGDVCAKYDAHVAEYTPGMTSIITNGMPWIKSETPGQCVVMKNGLPANVSCSSTSFYVMCELDWDKKFQLRQRNLKEVIYLQLVSDESAIYFISRDNAVLIDSHTIRIYDEVYEADHIHLGRMVNLVNRKSNTTSTITLSTCNKNEFTCDNGSCIHLDMRCNGVNDCPAEGDDSDETHCDNVHEPPESYNKDRPPLSNTPLVIAVKMVRVHEVSVEEGLVQIWLRTITKWQDSRLKFTHLSDIARDNIIRNPDRIWLPKYSLPNALFKDDENYRNNMNLRSTVFIHRLGSGEFDIHNGYEVYEYNGGKDVELEKDDDFLVSYLCDFELDYFPFDCHVCYIEIVIVNHGSFTSHFDMARLQIDSAESPTTLFYVSKLKLCLVVNETHVSRIVMKFMVSRNAGAFILTTFLPSMILGIIGCFTHTLDEKAFSDRIMVTLTCLIVIASLFSTTTSVTPNSASPKLVDIFFFFYIARLFMIFIIHSVLVIANKKRKKLEESIQQNHEFLKFKRKLSLSYAKTKNLKGSMKGDVQLPLRSAWEDDVEMALKPDSSVKLSAMNLDKLGLVLGIVIDTVFLFYFSAIIISERYNLFRRFESDTEHCPLSSVH